ncbi:MAG: N4-gp56 family major capsid protein [Oceanospirillaceae bacterium]|nr:N4-gp56 family major capsid protein [Oceanospirillaceae bacterium]
MADTNVATGLTVQQWDAKYFRTYIQENPFMRYMGTGENSIFQIKEDLKTKKGQSVTFSLVNRLTNGAVLGSNTLEGNEEEMTSRSHKVEVDKRRNAVRVAEIDEQFSAISLRNAAKPTLMDWSIEDTRDQVLDALGSINGTVYGSASEGAKDAWLADNADRVLFGSVKSNNSGNDHSASLANIDNSADQLDTGALSLMKRMALAASPKIRPIRVAGMNKRFFVCFVHPYVMRDLKTDTVITSAQRDVVLRNQNNKLFEGGDVEWDGIIVHEVDDMPILSGVGAGGIDVSPVYFCGAQALGVAYAKRWKSVQETFDYGDKVGVAIETIMGIDKLEFGTGADDTTDPVDHGLLTGYFAAVADS